MIIVLISVKKNSIIIVGGTGADYKETNSIEVISSSDSSGRNYFPIPNFPKPISRCFLFMKNGTLLLCGGKNWNGSSNETCFQLKNGSWQPYKDIKTTGRCISNKMVMTSKATFTFGTDEKCNNVRYLPHNSKNWKVSKARIPAVFVHGFAIEVKSKREIWLIGGVGKTNKQILSFNLETLTFKELPMKLNVGRACHKCIVTKIGNSEVILVTGGINDQELRGCGYETSVEIIDIQTGKVTLSPPMNIKRVAHGIGTLNINNQPRIAVFGGYNGNHAENTIEIFDPETLKWEIVEDFKMNESRDSFGCLTF